MRTIDPGTRVKILPMNILFQKALHNQPLENSDLLSILQIPDSEIWNLLSYSDRLRFHFKGNKVKLCSIANVKNGSCSENCGFCAQSAHFATGNQAYGYVGTEKVKAASDEAKDNGACLGLVSQGWGLKRNKDRQAILETISQLSKSRRVDASLGILDEDDARALKEAGLACYNHNIEAAPSFFDQVVTTHSYQDRINTIRNIKAQGIHACVGGIFGMGETLDQRVEFAQTIRLLDVDVIPINFLHHIHGTPIAAKAQPMSPIECLKSIAMLRFANPTKDIKVAGGREANIRDLQALVFAAGANSILIGNYLTTYGRAAADDLKMIADLGLEVVTEEAMQVVEDVVPALA